VFKSLQKTKKLIGKFSYEGNAKKNKATLQFYISNKVMIDMDSDVEIDTTGLTKLNLLVRYDDIITNDERIRLQFEGALKNKMSNFLAYGMPNDTKNVGYKIGPNNGFKLSRFSSKFIGYMMDIISDFSCNFQKCVISIL